jgi:hypothetical protein
MTVPSELALKIAHWMTVIAARVEMFEKNGRVRLRHQVTVAHLDASDHWLLGADAVIR